MIRRRHRTREIPFSFDSFLDVVANVVGIIIRLILVVWVGARSYSTLSHLVAQKQAESQASASLPPLPRDPLESDVTRQRRQLAGARALLLNQLRELQGIESNRSQLESQWHSLDALERTAMIRD